MNASPRSSQSVQLSLCIAVYNLDRWLDAFLDRLDPFIDQPEIEILFVDDGSSDASPEKLRSFCTRVSNAHVIEKEANGGLYQSRKTAVHSSVGEYLWLLDGDDLLDKKSGQALVDLVKQMPKRIECVFFDYVEFWGSPMGVAEFHGASAVEEIMGPGLFLEPLAFRHNVWRYIYRRDFVESFYGTNRYHKDFGEDFILSSSMVPRIRQSIYLRAPVYLYRRERPDAFTGDKSGLALFKKNIGFYRALLSTEQSMTDNEVLKNYALRSIGIMLSRVKSSGPGLPHSFFVEATQFLQEYELEAASFRVYCNMIDDWNKLFGRITHTNAADRLEECLWQAQC